MTCYAVETWGDHIYAVTYTRPWRRGFRKTRWLQCWHCDLKVMEP